MMKPLLVALPMILAASLAAAHPGDHATGLSAGALHPFQGLDHLLAMLGVGLWAAVRGGTALWSWPVAILAALVAGFAVAQAGIVLPGYEMMILGSVLGLGVALALALSLPTALGAALVALFGLVHGYAHGLEVSGGVAAFAAGFVTASALLHLAGAALGWAILNRLRVPMLARASGVGLVAAGLALSLG